jgi:hypothetical protein
LKKKLKKKRKLKKKKQIYNKGIIFLLFKFPEFEKMENEVVTRNFGHSVTPVELLQVLWHEHQDIMGAAQSNQRASLVRFDRKFTEFMRSGARLDGEVLLSECFGAETEYEGIPDWKRAAVLAGCRAWNMEFSDSQTGEWNALLVEYSFIPDEGEYTAPIVKMEEFLDVAEMLIRGWNVVQNRIGAFGGRDSEEPPFETDVMDLVVNRLESLCGEDFAYPTWFVGRVRQILYGYEPAKIDDTPPPLEPCPYENPPHI